MTMNSHSSRMVAGGVGLLLFLALAATLLSIPLPEDGLRGHDLPVMSNMR